MPTKNSYVRRVVFSTVIVAVSLTLSYSAGPAPHTRIFHFDYKVAVENIPGGAKHIDVWVPIPHGDAHQQIANLRVYAAYPSAMEQANVMTTPSNSRSICTPTGWCRFMTTFARWPAK